MPHGEELENLWNYPLSFTAGLCEGAVSQLQSKDASSVNPESGNVG